MRLWRLKRKALGHAKNGKETPVSAVTAAAGIFGTRTFQAQKQQARTFAAQLAWRAQEAQQQADESGMTHLRQNIYPSSTLLAEADLPQALMRILQLHGHDCTGTASNNLHQPTVNPNTGPLASKIPIPTLGQPSQPRQKQAGKLASNSRTKGPTDNKPGITTTHSSTEPEGPPQPDHTPSLHNQWMDSRATPDQPSGSSYSNPRQPRPAWKPRTGQWGRSWRNLWSLPSFRTHQPAPYHVLARHYRWTWRNLPTHQRQQPLHPNRTGVQTLGKIVRCPSQHSRPISLRTLAQTTNAQSDWLRLNLTARLFYLITSLTTPRSS